MSVMNFPDKTPLTAKTISADNKVIMRTHITWRIPGG